MPVTASIQVCNCCIFFAETIENIPRIGTKKDTYKNQCDYTHEDYSSWSA